MSGRTARLARALAIACLLGPATPALADQSTTVTPGSPLNMAGLATFINNALATLGTCFSGATPPATYSGSPKLYQCWVDTSTTPKMLRIYDGASWLAFAAIDTVNHIVNAGGPGGTLALASNLNSNIANPGTPYARISGPGAAFSIGGFTGGQSALRLTVYNATAYAMTIVNEDTSSSAANRIKTLTGANVTLRSGTSAATFIYDATDQRWILVSTN